MIKPKLAAIAALCLALSACGGPSIFVKPGTTEGDIASQQYACRMQSKIANPGTGMSAAIDRGYDFYACMDAHGYADLSTPRGQAKAASWTR